MPYIVPFGPTVAEASGDATTFPHVLSLPKAREEISAACEHLLKEAISLARQLGCQVIKQPCGEHGSSLFWVRGRKRLLLDPEQSMADQLAWVAEALRDDFRLTHSEMSDSLAEYLLPCRAA